MCLPQPGLWHSQYQQRRDLRQRKSDQRRQKPDQYQWLPHSQRQQLFDPSALLLLVVLNRVSVSNR
jgi:hypothetical protein